MARYSMKELKEKSGGGANIRKLKLEDGIAKKIWLPLDDVVYKRTHFDIKTRTSFKHSSKNVLDCCNQEYGEKGAGCPICDETQKLWEEWRNIKGSDEKAKAAKKKITNQINNIVSEDFWMNCIDIDNPTEFVAVRFTKSKYLEIEKIAERFGLVNVTWLYKYNKDANKYTLIENTDNEAKVKELKGMLEELSSREPENGGPIDIEKALIRPITPDRMLDILKGNGDEDEEEHVTDEDEKPSKSKMVVSEESTSLEDLSLDDEKKDKPKDKLDEQLSLDDDKLESEDIGDIGLDDLKLDDEPKKVIVTYEMITEKVKAKDVDWFKKLSAFLVAEKKITKKDSINDTIKEIAAFIKKSGPVEVPETKF